MSKDWTEQRFAWFDQMIEDGVDGADFKTACILATKFINKKKRMAWMAIETLARVDGRSVRRVQDSLTALKDRGHLEIIRRGKGNASHYRMIIKERTKTSDQETVRQDEIVRSNEPMNGQKRPINEGNEGLDRTKSSVENGRNRPRNPLNEPFEKNLSPEEDHPTLFPKPSKKEEAEKHFNELWAVYPRKVEKADARKAYGTALKKASPETILAGARRYAVEKKGELEKFIRYPATWLNKESWTNGETSAAPVADDFSKWPRAKQEDAIALAKKRGAWSPAYGSPSNIPADLMDAELEAIIHRGEH